MSGESISGSVRHRACHSAAGTCADGGLGQLSEEAARQPVARVQLPVGLVAGGRHWRAKSAGLVLR